MKIMIAESFPGQPFPYQVHLVPNFSQRLDPNTTHRPQCLCAVAATVILIDNPSLLYKDPHSPPALNAVMSTPLQVLKTKYLWASRPPVKRFCQHSSSSYFT